LLSGNILLTAEMVARLSVVMGGCLIYKIKYDLWGAKQWDAAENLNKIDFK
jgi:plasmid maintenance system antidote protein VapI